MLLQHRKVCGHVVRVFLANRVHPHATAKGQR
jgi:hypothetical protein